MKRSIGQRLEQYSARRPQEVLLVKANINGEEDEIAIFKGFSSSLMRATAFDPDVPVLPENAAIVKIDRLKSPFNPNNPQYIERELTWDRMQQLLDEVGV